MSRGYDRLAWVDYPAELTPISAENLNRIEDGIETLYNDRDHMESNLAIVDDNERASRDYAINTYVMRNGVFYKVILDIQENEEFNDEAGGNIRPVSVSSQLGSGGGGSTGCVELTQAEYDALPEEDKMADVIYLITDTPNNFLDEVFGDFASVEYTNKASKAYAVGEYLMLDSKLYRVTAAISQNDTITVGTNVIATTVGSEFNAVGNRLHNVLGNYAEVEPEAVASKIYAAGDFLILNDYLYKTTSAIATGEDLIEGTNIEKTTVDDELDALHTRCDNSVKIVRFVSGSYTIAANTHNNLSIDHTYGSKLKYPLLLQTPNAAHVFANIHIWDSTSIKIGYYNSAGTSVSGTFAFALVLYGNS